MQIALLFIIVSPFTAYLPLIYMSYKWGISKKSFEWSPAETSLIFLFLISLLSALVNRSFQSLVGSMGLLLFAGGAFYLQQRFNDEEKVQDLLLRIWPFAFVAGLFGLLEKAFSFILDMTWFGSLFWSPNFIPSAENYRIYATFGNPNVAGAWFASMTLLSIYLWETEVKRRGMYIAGVAVFSAALIFTGSRGAILSLLAALVVYALITRNGKLQRSLFILIGSVGLLALISPEVNHWVDNRTGLWSESIKFILERPLTGWGIWGVMENIGNVHSHNTWLTLLFFFGVPGLAVYGFWKSYLYKGLIRLHANGSKLAVLLISSQVYFVIHGIVDFIWMTPQGGALFFSLCGVTAGLMKKVPVVIPSQQSGVIEKQIG